MNNIMEVQALLATGGKLRNEDIASALAIVFQQQTRAKLVSDLINTLADELLARYDWEANPIDDGGAVAFPAGSFVKPKPLEQITFAQPGQPLPLERALEAFAESQGDGAEYYTNRGVSVTERAATARNTDAALWDTCSIYHNHGSDAVFKSIIDAIDNGAPVTEAFSVLSNITPRKAVYVKTNDDDMPLGITRYNVDKKLSFKPTK